jgi:endogenous inhibitor of DNA gyrase (YacG/DUF329 family)
MQGIMHLRDALEDCQCPKCGKDLSWGSDLKFEPKWTVTCCGVSYEMTVLTVEIQRQESEDDDDDNDKAY